MKKLYFILLLLPMLSSAQSSLNMNLLGTYDYPTTKGNDIWGWADSIGNEFALVGLRNGVSCVNVTNPSTPFEEFFIADIYSVWRDIKTYGNYAYVTTESDAGLLIIDLTDMTGATFWHVTDFINPTTGSTLHWEAAHDLFIDENGIAYIFGASNPAGIPAPANGAIFLDVATNPTNPTHLGQWNEQYIHDAMVRGDTMYAGCIYAGKVYIVDVSNKANPTVLGSKSTPNTFTHNSWVSDDGDFVFTTDEQSDAYLTVYDISDLNNIQEVDRIQSNPGSNSIPHNTFVDGNFLITSYYRDGTVVHDITHPNYMIEVGNYDSYFGSGNGFDGCWGTYPYLPSGNIISSDINSSSGKGRLLIYGRNFQQACYLKGNIINSITGLAIPNANMEILTTLTTETANLLGHYQSAIVNSGTYQLVFSALGFNSDTITALLSNGQMHVQDAYLHPTCLGIGITGLYSSNVIHDRATINWDDLSTISCSVDQYRINYKITGTSSWSQKNMGAPLGTCNTATNKTNKLLLNLIPSTNYEYQMKVWFCDGDISEWSSIQNFTTLGECTNINNLQVSTPTNTKATFTWNTSSVFSFVRIKTRIDVVGSTWFNVGGFGITYPILTKNKNGLIPGASYRAQARTWCSSSGGAYRSATWSPIIFWTQPGIIRFSNPNLTERTLLRTTDLLGREVNSKSIINKNTLFYIYDDGSVEKKIVIE
tara:strand:+ start:138 stop:2258 length:2121 start_codon:yes stop_codon:yes gene_type:complete